jgi:hypothetical protein
MKWKDITTNRLFPTHQLEGSPLRVEFHVLRDEREWWVSYYGEEIINKSGTEIQAKVACELLLERFKEVKKQFVWDMAYRLS